MINDDLYQQALKIAENDDIATLRDSVVLYSVSFLPTRENKDNAFELILEDEPLKKAKELDEEKIQQVIKIMKENSYI